MMSAPGELHFWFEFGSTYSYPAAMRIEAEATRAAVALFWRPFLLGPIFGAQGWNDSPFNIYAAKGRYMWRDLERICAAQGIPFRHPSRFPRNGLLAARVALLAAGEGWCGDFARAVYHANFAEDREIGERDTVAAIVAALGLDAGDVLGRALDGDNKERLRTQTEAAVRLGIFGAPSFVAGGELFWGNDRLEDALAWSARGGGA